MRLERYLHSIADNSESYFQAHLAREDLARIGRLKARAEVHCQLEALQRDALYLEWTPGDLRTGELKEVLLPLIAAMHEHLADPADAAADEALLSAWKAFHEARIKVLIHCL